ncbi:MAG: hypothetical protein Q8936_11745 [Bacillota bacterium]|nr:hypothetical protein [Bacillota bacterium]
MIKAVFTMKKLFTIWFIMGMMYFTLEGFFRGWTNISMLFVGGLCGMLIGELDEHSGYFSGSMWGQCILGTLIILIIEFVSGMILNVWLKLNVWDYSHMWGNLYGQICVPYAFIWFMLVPFAIYIDDYLRYKFFDRKKPEALIMHYRNLFLGK